MGKTIEIRLSDAQHAALSAEATASGNASFFGYCREKLMAGTEIKRKEIKPLFAAGEITPDQPLTIQQVRDLNTKLDQPSPIKTSLPQGKWISPEQATPGWSATNIDVPLKEVGTEPDRLSRIEDAVARLTDFVLQNSAARASFKWTAEHMPTDDPHLPADPIDIDDMVSRQVAEAEAEGLTEYVPDQADIEMQHAGVRPLAKRPMRFASASVPRHLQDVL